jgi:hypothetical protein
VYGGIGRWRRGVNRREGEWEIGKGEIGEKDKGVGSNKE